MITSSIMAMCSAVGRRTHELHSGFIRSGWSGFLFALKEEGKAEGSESIMPTRSPHRLRLSVPPPHIVTDGKGICSRPRKSRRTPWAGARSVCDGLPIGRDGWRRCLI
ncbi:MAG: hypothetical protein J6W75_02905 [Bacteroidaceae bacterium]|nr:hypothetical protein [Bacteroidaceae bacterium]